MSIFSILNHPCSFTVYYYLFGVFFYFSKLLFPGSFDFKVILYVAKTSYLYYLLKVTKDNLDAVLQQQIMDQFRKDNEALLGHLEQRKMKSLEDTKVIKSLDSTLSNIIDLKKLEYSYPTLFKTTICDFLFPIYDLTKNLIPFSKTGPLNQYHVSDLLYN